MRLSRLLLPLVLVAIAACSEDMGEDKGEDKVGGKEAPTVQAVSAELASVGTATESPAPQWIYPQSRELGSHRIVIHAPQIRAWPEFASLEALMAIEFYPDAREQNPLYATVTVTGATELQLEQRQVVINNPQVTEVEFAGGGTAEYVSALQASVRNDRLEMPLDLFLASLEEDVLDTGPSAGFNTRAPEILVEQAPTILLYVPVKPYLQALEQTGLQLAANANWPLVFDPGGNRWYLLYRDLWLSSEKLDGPWQPVQELPSRLTTLSADGAHASLLAAIPPAPSDLAVPAVLYRNEPAELLVINGEPELEAIDGGSGDSPGFYYVSNTELPLLKLDDRWFFLAAGRWFASSELDNAAEWEYQAELPAEFAAIPSGHELGWLRASIPGTPEARMEALEAILPQSQQALLGSGPGIEVVYDGEPIFQPISGTTVARAANSPNEVLLVAGVYYLCYEGAWYSATQPVGPWAATADVPPAIYDIPPQSPSYAVTDVKVDSSTSDTVTYTHTGVYSSGTYVSGGVTVYSTGWYYPPYLGAFYIPYYPAYGGGRYYNPNTGAYGARSVWYGPYGGYSYGEGYNPNTGRYGYRETAWDGDDWESYSEVYGERRDTKTKTERSYDDDDGKYKMERKIEGENDAWVKTDRTTNVEDGWQKTTRESSRGGSSEMNREWDKDGNLTSSGTINAADGRSATITGDYQDGDGVTTIKGSEGGEGTIDRSRQGDTVSREGEFTRADGETLSSSTHRDGRRSVTEIDSASGGQLKSVSEGGSRVSAGETASGDIYAGHNGDVYKKTDGGWQQYNRDSEQWQSSDSSRAAASTQSSARAGSENTRERSAASDQQRAASNRQRAQLERDAAARNRGQQRFEQRSRSSRSGGRRGRGRRR
jgi:hypothetical protein